MRTNYINIPAGSDEEDGSEEEEEEEDEDLVDLANDLEVVYLYACVHIHMYECGFFFVCTCM